MFETVLVSSRLSDLVILWDVLNHDIATSWFTLRNLSYRHGKRVSRRIDVVYTIRHALIIICSWGSCQSNVELSGLLGSGPERSPTRLHLLKDYTCALSIVICAASPSRQCSSPYSRQGHSA